MPEWRRCTIGDLCDAGIAELQTGPFGSQLHAHDYVEEGISVVPTEAIHDRQVDHSLLPQISIATAGRLSRHRLKPGDILFARRGVQATGQVAYVRPAEDGFICGTGAIRLRVNIESEEVASDFLSHALTAPESVEWLKFHAIGATMPNLNEGIVRSFPLCLPPAWEQRSIASTLSTLDDKIALNRRMSKTLEAVARALFKSWFSDFDPIRAKGEGRDPGLSTDVADLFSNSFVASELGNIPVGWKIAQVASELRIIKGISYRSEDLVTSDVALVTLKSIARGGGYRPEGLKEYRGAYKPEQVVRPGELIVAQTDVTQAADVIGKPALVLPDARGRTLVASLDLLIVRPVVGDLTSQFFFLLFLTEAFQEHVFGYTNGTTVLHLDRAAVPAFQFVRPPECIGRAFSDAVRPLFARLQENAAQSYRLTALRETLLPRLISGELRVKDAARLASEADA